MRHFVPLRHKAKERDIKDTPQAHEREHALRALDNAST
jgi:hypothetical protein